MFIRLLSVFTLLFSCCSGLYANDDVLEHRVNIEAQAQGCTPSGKLRVWFRTTYGFELPGYSNTKPFNLLCMNINTGSFFAHNTYKHFIRGSYELYISPLDSQSVCEPGKYACTFMPVIETDRYTFVSTL